MITLNTRSTRHRATALGVTVTVAAALATSACGASADSSTSTPGGSGSATPEEFGLSLAVLSARIETTEGLVAECMTGAGFEYVALDFVSIMDAMSSDQSAKGVADEDYLKQYGMGITTQLDKPIVKFGAGPLNNAYLEALPASDHEAFRRALWGETPERNLARALEDEDFSETGGCTRWAAEQTFTPTEVSGGYLNPADKLVEQDPRMIAALAAWSDCMRVGGYGYEHPDQVDDDLLERLDAISQGQDPTTLTGPALDALHQVQGEELAIAVVVTTCEKETIEPAKDRIELELFGS